MITAKADVLIFQKAAPVHRFVALNPFADYCLWSWGRAVTG